MLWQSPILMDCTTRRWATETPSEAYPGAEQMATMPITQRTFLNFRGGKTSASLPITFVGFHEAARFVNWLHNGQGKGSTETGAYTISQGQVTRASVSGRSVTITTAQPHTLSPGDRVTVSSDNETFNGTFAVGGTTETTFTYQIRVFHITPLQVAVTGSMRGVSETPLAGRAVFK